MTKTRDGEQEWEAIALIQARARDDEYQNKGSGNKVGGKETKLAILRR